MNISENDRQVLGPLAERWAAAAANPVNATRRRAWIDRNALKGGRPLVYIYQVAWQEFPEVATLRCEDGFLRKVEHEFRRKLWEWEHFPGDMVLEPFFELHTVVHQSSFGLEPDREATAHDRGAAHYEPVLTDEADLAQLHEAEIAVDREETDRRRALLEAAFGDVLPVREIGNPRGSISVWDRLSTLMGVTELFYHLVDTPDFVHACVARFTDLYLALLDRQEELGLLSTDTHNWTIGNGGLAFTDELPGDDGEVRPARAAELWGSSMSQIFSEVSPAMHETFALQYEKRWLARFGLVSYGCCEPLHHKIDLLRDIPNLRRISVSPFADVAISAEKIGTDYIFSYKPNPALTCGPTWDPDLARRELREHLDIAAGCHVEVILKDVHTVQGEPHRLDAWHRLAMEEVCR